ncbi:transcription factor PIF4-like isoform X2 [Tasmannia lanceolata]|uniref:transcription factor PIF4-like isoform X2 n=1 Tax=Tasmannia lanceolata TaxID=3420 RepID=UPI0040647401
MNHCIPAWNMEDDSGPFIDLLPFSNQRKSMGPDQDLVELLWKNGQVVLNSQTHRKPILTSNESKQLNKPEQPSKGGGCFGNSNNLIQEDEIVSWLQYPLDDSLEKEFCSDFFYDVSTVNSIGADKLSQEATGEDSVPQAPSFGRIRNFSNFPRPIEASSGSSNVTVEEKGSGNVIRGEAEDSSMMTIGLSHCSSNKVQYEADLSHASSNGVGETVKKDVQKMFFQSERSHTDSLEPAVTSSSGGSGVSIGRTSKQTASNQSHKRKGRDADESDFQSKEVEYESVDTDKPTQRTKSARQSRAVEVHNLSERRRRDRINEKMKALQQLIPHCNKIMWMRSGMAPMMFPGVQHYISCMGMGMGQAPLPSIHGPVQLPRVPLADQSVASAPVPNQPPLCPSPVLSPINFQNRMQNANFPDPYAHYVGFHPMHMAPQAMNLFNYGSQITQHSQRMAPPSSSGGPSDGGVSLDNSQNGN